MADGEDSILKKVHDVKKKIDEYFMKVAAGAKDLEWPQDDIDDLPKVEEFSKQIESIIADQISEDNSASEKETYRQMRLVDSTIKTYNLIQNLGKTRLGAFVTIRNNEPEQVK